MQRSYILANAKVIFRLVPKLYLLRKLYFDCRQSYILACSKVAVFSLTCPRRTLRFWNHVIGGDNAHTYACLRLFLHASTKVSCVVFLMRCPFREIATSRCSSQWHSTSYVIGKVFLFHFLCYTVQRTFCHCERSVAISRKGYLVKEWWLPNDCDDMRWVARIRLRSSGRIVRGGKVWFLSGFATKFGVFYNCRKLFWFRLRFLTLGKHNILWSEKFWKIFGIFRRKK